MQLRSSFDEVYVRLFAMVCGDGFVFVLLLLLSPVGWLKSGRKGGEEEERRQLLISPPKIQKRDIQRFSTLFLNVFFDSL